MTFLSANEHVASGSVYRLAPTDRIRILSPQAPEVDGSFGVRADGTVHLRLLGEVRVAGLTDKEAAVKLTSQLQSYYREPIVHVTIERPVSKVFYMFGEVGFVGGAVGSGGGDRGATSQPITGRDTIMNVLTTTPPTQNAWLSKIKVIRPGSTPDNNQEIVIDFYKMMSKGDMRQNILLQEGDIVYIPPTPMAWIGYRIGELLQPVAPVIGAYTTPARVISADDVYNNDNGSDDTNLIGNLRLP